jgi:hypothetical protein
MRKVTSKNFMYRPVLFWGESTVSVILIFLNMHLAPTFFAKNCGVESWIRWEGIVFSRNTFAYVRTLDHRVLLARVVCDIPSPGIRRYIFFTI